MLNSATTTESGISANPHKSHTRIHISGKTPTGVAGHPVHSLKGNPLDKLEKIADEFQQSARYIARNYDIVGNKINIQYIDVITASNEVSPPDTLTPVKPIEKDKVSKTDGADTVAWYSVTATIGDITFTTTEAYKLFRNAAVLKWLVKNNKITADEAADLKINPYSGWLCRRTYLYASDAAARAAVNVAYDVEAHSFDIVKALKLIYWAKKAWMTQHRTRRRA